MGPGQVMLLRGDVKDAGQRLSFVVHPGEEGAVSKVREYDLYTPLDSARQQFLAPAIINLVESRRWQKQLGAVEHEVLRLEFARAMSSLGLRGLGFSLCGLARGGTTHDRSVQTRDLAAV